MRIDAIFFDVSGTLVRETPDEYACVAQWLRTLGYTISAQAQALLTARMKNAAYAQLMAEANGAPRMDDADFFAMLAGAAMQGIVPAGEQVQALGRSGEICWQDKRMEPMDDAFDTLDALKARGFRLGVVSNHRRTLPALLEAWGLAKYFETIVVSEIEGIEKPDPAILHLAMERLSLEDAHRCLYVGDHPFDVLCAAKAGMRCAWLAEPGERMPEGLDCRADARIETLSDLLFLEIG